MAARQTRVVIMPTAYSAVSSHHKTVTSLKSHLLLSLMFQQQSIHTRFTRTLLDGGLKYLTDLLSLFQKNLQCVGSELRYDG